ncbi:MAG: S49 family peptidase [Anaerolineales bacterium]|nr:MAG: S49 family peptidase [Chloroflexota bacterium]MBE7434850.1 S49 family peptidase [Anaerolineales bacterium]
MSEADQRWERIRNILLWLVIPLILGLLAASAVPRPVVGVIRLEDAIYTYSAQNTIKQIQYAIDHPEVRAVVLVMDSPGGTVVDTESIYMELTRLREKKPVVTVVNGMAASGGYYLSVNTDYIFAKPTSLVGNIGVIGYLPPSPFVIEDIITTGPYKLWGAPRDSDMRQVEMIKEGFFQAVKLGRGDKLSGSDAVTFSGQIFSGIDGLKLGIIDEFGTENDGAKKAAELAKVANYEILDLAEPAGVVAPTYFFFMTDADGITLPYPREAGVYLLYIPPLPVSQ